MLRRGIAADRPNRLRTKAARLVEAVLTTEGVTFADARNAAFAGRADDAALAGYVNMVRRQAYRITDEDVQRLRDVGLDDDAIFELTVAAALGAGAERLQVGLSLLGREP
jgi:alkylhydroperoxidase family enzyme